MICLRSIESGRAQEKTGHVVGYQRSRGRLPGLTRGRAQSLAVVLVILAAVYWFHLTGFDPLWNSIAAAGEISEIFFPRASLKSTP
jgi:hypothetical protein